MLVRHCRLRGQQRPVADREFETPGNFPGCHRAQAEEELKLGNQPSESSVAKQCYGLGRVIRQQMLQRRRFVAAVIDGVVRQHNRMSVIADRQLQVSNAIRHQFAGRVIDGLHWNAVMAEDVSRHLSLP